MERVARAQDDHVCKRLSSKEIAIICVSAAVPVIFTYSTYSRRPGKKDEALTLPGHYEEYKRSGDKYTVLESQTYG